MSSSETSSHLAISPAPKATVKRRMSGEEYAADLVSRGLSPEEIRHLDPEIFKDRIAQLGINFDPNYKLPA